MVFAGQQADGKQNQIQQDNFLIPLRCRRRNKLVHGEGGRGFPADHCCPSQQQEQRDQGVGQHKKHKSPDAHAAFSIKIEVLRVADGGQHTAKVCRNGLHLNKFMRHERSNVPEYMLSGSRGDFTGVGDYSLTVRAVPTIALPSCAFTLKPRKAGKSVGKRIATAHANYVIEKIERQNCPTWQELELYQAVIDTTKGTYKPKEHQKPGWQPSR